ncbi:hypothetical protein LTR17_012515 [Elasticomyces elasticus]|nr:hypothetical protein LTR17_012515 [Elasticomyces elasticus]
MHFSQALRLFALTTYVLANPLALRQSNTCTGTADPYCCTGLLTAAGDFPIFGNVYSDLVSELRWTTRIVTDCVDGPKCDRGRNAFCCNGLLFAEEQLVENGVGIDCVPAPGA